MSLATEPSIRTLNRIYYYLRLSGVGEAAARVHLQEAAGALTASKTLELWAELDRRIATAEARGELEHPRLDTPPALQRGHIHYPES